MVDVERETHGEAAVAAVAVGEKPAMRRWTETNDTTGVRRFLAPCRGRPGAESLCQYFVLGRNRTQE